MWHKPRAVERPFHEAASAVALSHRNKTCTKQEDKSVLRKQFPAADERLERITFLQLQPRAEGEQISRSELKLKIQALTGRTSNKAAKTGGVFRRARVRKRFHREGRRKTKTT